MKYHYTFSLLTIIFLISCSSKEKDNTKSTSISSIETEKEFPTEQFSTLVRKYNADSTWITYEFEQPFQLQYFFENKTFFAIKDFEYAQIYKQDSTYHCRYRMTFNKSNDANIFLYLDIPLAIFEQIKQNLKQKKIAIIELKKLNSFKTIDDHEFNMYTSSVYLNIQNGFTAKGNVREVICY